MDTRQDARGACVSKLAGGRLGGTPRRATLASRPDVSRPWKAGSGTPKALSYTCAAHASNAATRYFTIAMSSERISEYAF